MAISVADNFSYKGAKPLDARIQYSTVANMKNATASDLYDGCLAYVTETKKNYQYDSSNTVDPTTGKWRELQTGGGGGGSYIELTGTLTAGETVVEFTDASLSTSSIVENILTSKYGVCPENVEFTGEVYQGLINDILDAADDTKVTAASTDSASVYPWKAFDGIKGISSGTYSSPYHGWLAGNRTAPVWLQYHFSSAKFIRSVDVYFYCNNSTYTGSPKIQASNDGTNWTDISDSVSISVSSGQEKKYTFECDDSQTWTYVRLYSTTAFTVYNGASVFVGEMEIYGGSRDGLSIKLTFPEQSEDLGVKVRVS